MKNFDTELDIQGVTRLVTPVTQTTTQVTVEETVRVIPKVSQVRTFVGKEVWSWSDLRDYVVAQIEDRFGPFPRDSRKEAAIFKSFLDRWGDQARPIAEYAFVVAEGRWGGAPISVNRFCKNSDPYFGQVIAERLVESPVKDW